MGSESPKGFRYVRLGWAECDIGGTHLLTFYPLHLYKENFPIPFSFFLHPLVYNSITIFASLEDGKFQQLAVGLTLQVAKRCNPSRSAFGFGESTSTNHTKARQIANCFTGSTCPIESLPGNRPPNPAERQ
ncbi:hypothetical protein PoB_006627800 [Plakobranchus ocellatus]|uniref:Uncharacterized protein n=1 Tax=Plakobranchus ocellatus TaxID=259542 RepID=A0AAV4D6T6_9GAST|nr:hypothetical protein PoB_006627800 [Plakobranchus ocellatus]